MNESESRVYITLLEEGALSIQEIVEKTGIPRTSIVVSINTLLKSGIIKFFIKGKRKRYAPYTPERLTNLLVSEEHKVQEKKERILELIPRLNEVSFLEKGGDSEMLFLEGEEGLRKLYEMTLINKKKEIFHISVASEKFGFIPEYLIEYTKRKKKLNIQTKLIIPKTELGEMVQREDDKNLRETRFISRNMFDPSCMITVWDKNVAFTEWNEKLKTVIFQRGGQADMIKSIFSILWISANK